MPATDLELNNELMSDFIQLYKSYPCLWQVKSLEYRNRDLKKNAWKALHNFITEHHAEATQVMVEKKIKNLRTVFQKEWKKSKESRSGAGVDTVYKSSWKFFKEFEFLIDQCQPRAGSSNITEEIDVSII